MRSVKAEIQAQQLQDLMWLVLLLFAVALPHLSDANNNSSTLRKYLIAKFHEFTKSAEHSKMLSTPLQVLVSYPIANQSSPRPLLHSR
jgi:hypothetical protein